MFDSFGTSWTSAFKAPLSMGFPRQVYWSGLPFPSLGDLPDPGTEPMSPALMSFPCDSAGKESTCNAEDLVWSLGWEDPQETGKTIHSSIQPGEFHGLYSSWGHKESDPRWSNFYFHFAFPCSDRQILYHWATCKAWLAVYVEPNGPATPFLEIYPKMMSADVHQRHGQEYSKQSNSKSPKLATTLRSTTE